MLAPLLTRIMPQRFFTARLAAEYRKSLAANGAKVPSAGQGAPPPQPTVQSPTR